MSSVKFEERAKQAAEQLRNEPAGSGVLFDLKGRPIVSESELPTIIAALKHWRNLPEPMPFRPGDDRTGLIFEKHDPMSYEAIDRLCDRLKV